jgi:hypothetical protein
LVVWNSDSDRRCSGTSWRALLVGTPTRGNLYSGLFFLVGLYALLITLPAIESVRGQVLTQYVNTALSGMRIHASA